MYTKLSEFGAKEPRSWLYLKVDDFLLERCNFESRWDAFELLELKDMFRASWVWLKGSTTNFYLSF
jgi:hypothetical protein